MAGEITVGSSNRRVRQDLNDDYEGRKEEIVDDNERKLGDLRAQYRKREDDIRTSGDAAISHIKKNAEERVASAQSE